MRNLHAPVEVVGTILLFLVPGALAGPGQQSEAARFQPERNRMVSRQIEALGPGVPFMRAGGMAAQTMKERLDGYPIGCADPPNGSPGGMV